MRRQLPLAIGFVVGVFMIVQFFVPHPSFKAVYETILDWKQIVFGCTLILGSLNLFRHHAMKVQRKEKGYFYNAVALGGFCFMVIAALGWGMAGGPYRWLFNNVQMSMQATMFSLLAFFVASASYRAFRARSVTATLLLVAGVVVMLGRVPIGRELSSWLPAISTWILNCPTMAAKRGVVIGVGLGMASTALKLILGIERSYLGKGD
jgi:hypothetical protein